MRMSTVQALFRKDLTACWFFMSENHFTEIRANQICFDKPVYVVNGIVFGHFTKTYF